MTCDLIEDDDDRRELARALANRLDILGEIAGMVRPGVRLDDTDLAESVRRCKVLENRLRQMPAPGVTETKGPR